MEKDKSVTPEDKVTFFADENYPAKFADNKWDALYTAYHSGYLDGSLYERQKQAELVGKLQERLDRCRKVSGYSSGFSDIHNEIDFLDLLLNSLKK